MANWRETLEIADGKEFEVEVYGDLVNSICIGEVGCDWAWLQPHQARALAAQLIAAADHAEGRP